MKRYKSIFIEEVSKKPSDDEIEFVISELESQYDSETIEKIFDKLSYEEFNKLIPQIAKNGYQGEFDELATHL